MENVASALPGLEWQSSGTAAPLVAGTLAIAANLTSNSSIQITMKDPGAGALTGFVEFEVPLATRVPGAPGSFTVNAIDDAKALVATATPTVDWVIVTPPAALSTWADWQAAPFLRRSVNYGTGSCVAQVTA